MRFLWKQSPLSLIMCIVKAPTFIVGVDPRHKAGGFQIFNLISEGFEFSKNHFACGGLQGACDR